MYKLWIEWDFGQDGLIFKTEESIWKYLEDNETFQEFLTDNKYTVEELKNEGLISIEKVVVV